MAGQLGDEVAVGAEGMLFHRFDWAFEQLCGDMSLSPSQQLRWRDHIMGRDAFCRARGIGFVMLVVPERHAVYSHCLPDGFALNPNRPMAQLGRMLRAEGYTSVIYPREILRAISRFHRTYHLTDQHMTDDGAYACYWAMAERFPAIFGQQTLQPETLTRSSSKLVGDLGIRLSEEAEEDTEYLRIANPRARKVGAARLPVGRIDVYEQPDSTLPKAVWFGDSHSFALLPFVAEHFSRLVIVQTQRFLTDLIEREGPDFVFAQTSESQIAYPVARDRLDVVRLPEDGHTDGLHDLYANGQLHQREDIFLAVNFAIGGNSDAYCQSGWSAAEPTQRWSDGSQSSLLLPAPPPGKDWEISIDAGPFFVATRLERQRVVMTCGGRTLASLEATAELDLTVPLDADVVAETAVDGQLLVEFFYPDAASPADFGSTDGRVLALGFRRLSIHA